MKYSDLENKWKESWFKFIKENNNLSWFWKYVSVNSNLTFDMINNNPQLLGIHVIDIIHLILILHGMMLQRKMIIFGIGPVYHKIII